MRIEADPPARDPGRRPDRRRDAGGVQRSCGRRCAYRSLSAAQSGHGHRSARTLPPTGGVLTCRLCTNPGCSPSMSRAGRRTGDSVNALVQRITEQRAIQQLPRAASLSKERPWNSPPSSCSAPSSSGSSEEASDRHR
ncbi:MAG: hypothetical protein MZV70_33745 [Desulfobacterales bacterium]|nr:hypothetical protein [Desulfobacterales bacterium]